MVDTACQHFSDNHRCKFSTGFHKLTAADYAVVSETFIIKSEINQTVWTDFVIAELHKVNDLSTKGFSFNPLTKYSDPDYIRSDLYYADPCFFSITAQPILPKTWLFSMIMIDNYSDQRDKFPNLR